MSLSGKAAVVTGASRGIGRAIAEALGAAGASVLINYSQDAAGAAATVAAIAAAGGNAQALQGDAADPAAAAALVGACIATHGQIDILVNNAGINIPKEAFDVTEEDWDRVLDINLKGLFFMSQRVGKIMCTAGGGKIVNIASQNGVVGYYKRAAYCSSKAGVVNLTRVLAIEWASHNITVNAVGPTFILTPLTQSTFDDPTLREDIIKRIPLGRVGQPEDVVGAVVFLASPAANLITGHTLLVDGGWTAL